MIWLAILGLLVLLLVLVYIWMDRSERPADTVVVQEGDWWGGWWGPWWWSGGNGGSWWNRHPHSGRPHHHPGPYPGPSPRHHMLGPGGTHHAGPAPHAGPMLGPGGTRRPGH